MFTILLITNIFASTFLCGLIWFVQIVQYPGFLKLPSQQFQAFHQDHIWRTGIVVIPPMLIELGSSIWLTVAFNQYWYLHFSGLLIVAAIWVSTFTLQAPIHQQLQEQYSVDNIAKLIQSNWIRTLLWSAKAVIGWYLIFDFTY